MLWVLEAARQNVDHTAREWIAQVETPRGRPVQHRSAQLGAAIGGWLTRVATAAWRNYQRRQVIKVLRAQSDHILADIGVDRQDIGEVAKAAVEHGPAHASQLAFRTQRARYDVLPGEEFANDNETRFAA